MARVLGVGGVFFTSPDPAALCAWYAKWLRIEIDPSFQGTSFLPAEVPRGGYTVWSPFAASTSYFEPSENRFMINLMVDDLDGALEQIVEGGAELVGDIESSEFGRFGWFLDPDGNKVELWQPPEG